MSEKLRKNYSREFKMEAVGLITEKGYSIAEASRNLGIEYSVLRRWKKQIVDDPQYAFPGKGRLKAPDEELRRLALGQDEIPMDRSQEFCSYILNAMETNEPYVFNGNVANTHLITNLLTDAIVEVPIMVDNCGLHPCHVGDLPAQLAALNRTSLAVQELAVQGLVEGDRESIHQAVQLDPLTSSLLSLDQIREMVGRMFDADAEWITI